jgi:hypothetical protein
MLDADATKSEATLHSMRTFLRLERDCTIFRQMASTVGCDDGDEPVGAMLTRLDGAGQCLQVQSHGVAPAGTVGADAAPVEIVT